MCQTDRFVVRVRNSEVPFAKDRCDNVEAMFPASVSAFAPQPLLERRIQGVVRQVNTDRGFGHIIAHDVAQLTSDLYFHYTWLRDVQLTQLRPGTPVEFRVRPSLKKPGLYEAYDIASPRAGTGIASSPPTDAFANLFIGRPSATASSQPAPASQTIKGVVRVLDSSRGFGHITPDPSTGITTDLFFHCTWCTSTPFAQLVAGTPVDCDIRPSTRKAGQFEAFNIVATGPAPERPAPTFTTPPQQMFGVIHMVDQVRGFGHITPPPASGLTTDVYFHHSTCITPHEQLQVGMLVQFELRPSAKKAGRFEAHGILVSRHQPYEDQGVEHPLSEDLFVQLQFSEEVPESLRSAAEQLQAVLPEISQHPLQSSVQTTFAVISQTLQGTNIDYEPIIAEIKRCVEVCS